MSRPKIGIALSGASGRAIAHIAVLEVLKENKIPIDYIVGCSSGAMIAVSYATDYLEPMKEWLYKLNFRKLLSMWTVMGAKGGIFSLSDSEKDLEKIAGLVKDMKFEDLPVKIGFTATDINTGELVTLSSGNIFQALKGSVAVPGLFEPVIIDNRILVDGGLVNIVPTKPARDMGADIVIGVNLAATKFIYEKKMPIWRGFRFMTRLLGLQFIREKVLPKLRPRVFFRFDSQSDVLEPEDIKIPGMISMLSKAIDHSFEVEKQWSEADIACDWMIEPRVKHFGKTEFESLQQVYEEGRHAASLAVPHIKELIKNYEHKTS